MKLQIAHLGTTLLKLHKELLQVQTEIIEKLDHKKYTPYDLLNLSLNDPRFIWLKKFSELIIKIDIITDDKKNTPFDVYSLIENVKKTISTNDQQSSEFKQALISETSLMFSLGEVKKALGLLEQAAKADKN